MIIFSDSCLLLLLGSFMEFYQGGQLLPALGSNPRSQKSSNYGNYVNFILIN